MTPAHSLALVCAALVGVLARPVSAAEPSELPRYDTPAAEPPAPEADTPPLRAVPPDGKGSLAAGSLLVIGGTSLIVGGAVLASEGFADALWGPPVVGGVLSTAAGGVFVAIGHVRSRRHRGWARAQADVIPPSGSGLIGSGSVLIGAGAAAGMAGTLVWFASSVGLPPRPVSPLLPAMIATGTSSLAVGATLLSIGMRRHRRFERWRRDDVALRPILSAGPGGAWLGVAGRL